MTLTFQRVVRDKVFQPDFENLSEDNQLCFPDRGIVVIYAPNGVGKSSLAAALSGEEGTDYEVTCNGSRHSADDETSLFHVIPDQNGRNIIKGSTEDFILGDNIRREYDLKEAIESDFRYLYNSVLSERLKSEFGISKKTSSLAARLRNETIRGYVTDLANKQSKGKAIDRGEFLSFVQSLSSQPIPEHENAKLNFIIDDMKEAKPVITQLLDVIEKHMIIDPTITRVEEHSDAITMLNKYYYLRECVVCDRDIERESLLERKTSNRKALLEQLDETTKDILDRAQQRLSAGDPFRIKEAITETAKTGETSPLHSVLVEIHSYIDTIEAKISNLFATCLDELSLVENYQEYKSLVAEKPELTDEDVLFIERFVNDCIERKIELVRDAEGNLQLLLGKEPFLNEDRQNLRLSNGEQNFISIAFELLKAQKVPTKIVVLDDPISSFDSIFKNKISYAIAKFLGEKKQILLTHNTDLVKLLEHQIPKSFNLYILNNAAGERNGFIGVSRAEQELVLYLHKLIDFLRNEVIRVVRNERLLLLALVPFMRSFSRMINQQDVTDELTQIMHGYGESSADLTKAYERLFGSDHFSSSHVVTVKDILETDVRVEEIIDAKGFPLLNRALLHILNYLWLRLQVENTLVKRYQINTNRQDQLSPIIRKAFGSENPEDIKRRVFLLSRKTLLNEFNHFEEDLNVFQPAIDITDTALEKERADIMRFLDDLRSTA